MVCRCLITAWVLPFMMAPPAFSSEEEFLDWRSVSIQCRETQEAGRVSCDAIVGEKGYEKFVIQAFGKTYSLGEGDRAKLAEFPLSSLRTTHEAGYARLGGYTVRLWLERTYYDKAKALVTETVYVSVNKEGVSVNGPSKKNL
ncbi:MAG: hypothetical protein HYU36_02340 [Planctomycetes bacterium]|nr:hypothetical protein [Planctomycetota bacterium]